MIPLKIVALYVAMYYLIRNWKADNIKLWQNIVCSAALATFFVLQFHLAETTP